MIGQLFPKRGDLLGCHRTGVVSPLASLVCHDIGNFLVGQRFVPRLHHRRAVLLAFNCDRALQAFEHNHAHPPRAPIRKFRTSKRRILARYPKTVSLMTGLTISRENLLTSVARREFSLLAAGRSSCDCFLRSRRRTHRIKSAADEISRVAPEVRAAKENRQSVDGNQPYSKRLSPDA